MNSDSMSTLAAAIDRLSQAQERRNDLDEMRDAQNALWMQKLMEIAEEYFVKKKPFKDNAPKTRSDLYF